MQLNRNPRIRLRAGVLLLASLFAAPAPATAQRDSVTIAAGERYRPRSSLHEWLLGGKYRALWTEPIRVPVLDLDSSAGGLVPIREGGNLQTRALRFRGADGREYNFRSVDKELTGALPSYARETAVDWIRQDLTSAQLPVAPVVAAELLDAAGVLHPGPELVVLPDDPALGKFRARFGGMLGTLEVHPNEGERGEPLFAGARAVVGTERLLEHLDESARHRVDSRAFLRARLMDLFLGDFDRHAGQWRWARYDRAGVHRWVPIPEDRDYAFVHYEGLLPEVARRAGLRRLVRFEETYPDPLAMLDNSLALNRRLLADLPEAAWDSAAVELQARLSDAVLERAVRRMPPPYHPHFGEELIRKLRARRDGLREMASRYYRIMAQSVEVHATDRNERAEVIRQPDGSMELRLFSTEGSPEAEPFFARRLVPGETEEVRIFLHGGDDRAEIRGAGGGIRIRIIGGGGDDEIRDLASGPTVLYDDRGDNRLQGGRDTRIRRDPPQQSGPERKIPITTLSRDWGRSHSLFTPWLGWHPHAELVIGGGPAWTSYAFRHHPYASRVHLRGLAAPMHGRFGMELVADVRRESSPRRLSVRAQATELEATSFHGFGNDAPDAGADASRIWQRRLSLRTLLHLPLAPAVNLSLGGEIRHTRPRLEAGSAVERLPSGQRLPQGEAGILAALEIDTRDDPWFPRRGARLTLGGAEYFGELRSGSGYGRVDVQGAWYRELPLGPRPVLATRAGGSLVLGRFPFFEAATLGGRETLRGYRFERFAGDGALFGGTELRVPLGTMKLLVRGTSGVSLFADAGRVYHERTSPGGWHTAVGGSLWFATPLASVTLGYARGEEGRVHLGLGMPF